MSLTAISIEGGAVAQLGERRFCKPEVAGSIPVSSTISFSLNEESVSPVCGGRDKYN